MWTPLYYEASSGSHWIPRIYPQKSNYGGWLKSSSYPFPEKENFVSYKISKQNNRAIYGRDQAVLVDCYDDTDYTAFFLEEAN
jgi:ABC-type phosphate transport system auxiliary subunit